MWISGRVDRIRIRLMASITRNIIPLMECLLLWETKKNNFEENQHNRHPVLVNDKYKNTKMVYVIFV